MTLKSKAKYLKELYYEPLDTARKFMIIEDMVYIAPGVKIIGDKKIGTCSEIGANAVVTKDVEPYTCVAGVPATVIKKLGPKPRFVTRIYIPK